MNNMESSKGEIVMYQLNDVVELDVRLEDETVWLTQQQMSELFSVKENTVTYHIKEIYKTEELEKEGTARKIRVVRKEGNRNVRRTIDYYNLDMIISVGYKVNSKRGVKFRQWATQVLKDHLLKGYSVNKSLQEVKTQLGTQDKRISLLEDKAAGLFFKNLWSKLSKLSFVKMSCGWRLFNNYSIIYILYYSYIILWKSQTKMTNDKNDKNDNFPGYFNERAFLRAFFEK